MPEIISATDRPRTAKVSFGVVEEVASLARARSNGGADPRSNAKEIGKAFVAGASIVRYGREWHMGQTQHQGRWITGRIGFQAAGVTELWNATLRDFEESRLSAGTTSPFALNAGTQRIVFQIRPGFIRPNSFTGALQALMNEGDALRRWRVSTDTRRVEWPDWINSIDRLVELRFTLNRPNPNYKDREKVRELIEGLDAATVQIIARADPEDPDGLTVDDAFVSQMIEHASHDGTWRAVGEKAGEPDPLKWRSDEEVLPEHTVQADPETKEASPEDLKNQLGEADAD